MEDTDPHHRTQLTAKGIYTVKTYSELRYDFELRDHLLQNPNVVNVHFDCRRNYTNKRRYEQSCANSSAADHAPPKKQLRDPQNKFDWEIHCFFCGDIHPPGGNREDPVSVRTLEMKETILLESQNRTDSWTLEVRGRLNMCNDLVAAEAIYHKYCRSKFYNLISHTAGVDKGRPEDPQMYQRFVEMCEWLEAADDDVYTLYDLQDKLSELSNNDENVYSIVHLKRKLQEHYGDHLFFASVGNRKNVICFRNMAESIINDKWYSDRSTSVGDESIRVVTAAAKLIRAQIRESQFKCDEYPIESDFTNVDSAKEWVPKLLTVFLENIIKPPTKQTSIGHAIVQANKPKSAISPLLFGIGVSLDHMFGSRILLDFISRLGFSVSYDELCRYKQSLVQSTNSDMPHSFAHSFTQGSGDNVDHNIKTIDGTGTFHGMGIISMTTPCNRLDPRGLFSQQPVKRLQRSKVSEVVKNRGIPISYYVAPDRTSLSMLKLKPVSHLLSPYVAPPSLNLDLAWHIGWFFTDTDNLRPGWAGFMHDVTPPPSDFPPPSDIRMLPIIDMNPNDMTCIHSTLLFTEKQSVKLNLETACVTFDQPLWLKSVEIVMSTNLNIVCRLGGFHTLMSFLGSIGSIMEGSGLDEALQNCYGPNAVVHMLSGKAVERAVRGHFLTESALNVLMLTDLTKISPDDEALGHCRLSDDDMHDLEQLYTDVANKKIDLCSDVVPACLNKLLTAIREYKLQFQQCRTARMWLQYMYYVNIMKNFIRAERTGDWHLHLQTVAQMLNLFAATGHTNYAKSCRLYLQLMLELPSKYPWLYQHFMAGRFHAVRRSDRFWAGLSTDLVIEQVMMRALKSRGGLTHGRGMTESV